MTLRGYSFFLAVFALEALAVQSHTPRMNPGILSTLGSSGPFAKFYGTTFMAKTHETAHLNGTCGPKHSSGLKIVVSVYDMSMNLLERHDVDCDYNGGWSLDLDGFDNGDYQLDVYADPTTGSDSSKDRALLRVSTNG
ncbi:MAG: hypothetical protein ABIR96_00415 [Bdellovibrionota bacterium]